MQCSKCHAECREEHLYPVEIPNGLSYEIVYMCLACLHEWYEGD
jgi:hypothetical protein